MFPSYLKVSIITLYELLISAVTYCGNINWINKVILITLENKQHLPFPLCNSVISHKHHFDCFHCHC